MKPKKAGAAGPLSPLGGAVEGSPWRRTERRDMTSTGEGESELVTALGFFRGSIRTSLKPRTLPFFAFSAAAELLNFRAAMNQTQVLVASDHLMLLYSLAFVSPM